MDNRSIFERDYAGEPVSPNEPNYQLLITDIEDCIVGANAVVTRDVPPYAIAAGNPAKIIKYIEH